MKKYVWLDTATGKFSQSWTNDVMSLEKVIEINKPYLNETTRLIEYEVQAGNDFEFNDITRLA